MARGVSRRSLALRGVAVVVALAVTAGVLVAAGNDSLSPAPEITATLPASAGPVRTESTVQYHGVDVGTLEAVDARVEGSTLRLRMDENLLGQVPANVRVRVLPRTLFGDQYVDLTVPGDASPRGSLAAGDALQADRSGRTVQLYTAYSRFYDVITALRPADLQTAMTTLADTLRGRGERLGRMIDDTAAFLDEASPLVDTLEKDLDTIAHLSKDTAAATPDLLDTLENTTAVARTASAERASLGNLLGAGIDVSDTARRVLSEHGDRVVRLAKSTEPISDVLSRHPTAADESLDAARFFLVGGARTFSTGNFTFDAALTLKQPYPYTAADCPRYPGMAGQNCGQAPSSRHERTVPRSDQDGGNDNGRDEGDRAAPRSPEPPPSAGGSAGPVGSRQEKDALSELGGLLPRQQSADTGRDAGEGDRQDPNLLGLMLGPLVRGRTAVVP